MQLVESCVCIYLMYMNMFLNVVEVKEFIILVTASTQFYCAMFLLLHKLSNKVVRKIMLNVQGNDIPNYCRFLKIPREYIGSGMFLASCSLCM